MKKKFAPILIITICILFVLLWLAGVVLSLAYAMSPLATIAIFIMGAVLMVVIIALVAVLYSRLKEIDKEEDDDLSKY